MHPPVFLIHGFHSDSSVMNDFAKVLKSDFDTILIDLPLAFNSLNSALSRLKLSVLECIEKDSPKELYFIGHSTGGIIIRMLMKDTLIASITKVCLFVGTPNNGTILADFHQSLPPIIKDIHLPLKELTKDAIYRLMLYKPHHIVYGAIAGSQTLPMTDFFFNCPNDGFVATKSVFMTELNDYIILPYNHFDIHHQVSTCLIGRHFLKNKRFPKALKEGQNMEINEKFVRIIQKGFINELCAQMGGNVDIATLGGKVWWNEIETCNGWKLQQNKISQHYRILNPDNVRKAFGFQRTI